jgi:hypothetical protein
MLAANFTKPLGGGAIMAEPFPPDETTAAPAASVFTRRVGSYSRSFLFGAEVIGEEGQ